MRQRISEWKRKIFLSFPNLARGQQPRQPNREVRTHDDYQAFCREANAYLRDTLSDFSLRQESDKRGLAITVSQKAIRPRGSGFRFVPSKCVYGSILIESHRILSRMGTDGSPEQHAREMCVVEEFARRIKRRAPSRLRVLRQAQSAA